MSATLLSFPPIPAYLGAPLTFVCGQHGAMMLAEWADECWLFRVHGDHWCTMRRATPEDITALHAAFGEKKGAA